MRKSIADLWADDAGTEALETLLILACVVLPIVIGLIRYKDYVYSNFRKTWDELTRG